MVKCYLVLDYPLVPLPWAVRIDLLLVLRAYSVYNQLTFRRQTPAIILKP